MSSSEKGSVGDHFKGRYSQHPSVPQPNAAPQPEATKPPEPVPIPRPLPDPDPPLADRSVVEPLNRPAALEEEKRTPPGAAGLAGLAALVALVLGGITVMNRGPAQRALVWQASCGSAPVAGSSWWPVLGPGQAVDAIRSRYCGDAYLTKEGAAQVASFSSSEEATAFAERLSRESGYAFRVGQPRTP